MDFRNEISSSEDEFNFEPLRNEIVWQMFYKYIITHTKKKLILENRVFKDIDMYKSLKYDIFIS